MIPRIGARPQRIPMVDAGTLEDRTRPPYGAAPPHLLRLGYFGQAKRSGGLRALRERRRAQAMLASRRRPDS